MSASKFQCTASAVRFFESHSRSLSVIGRTIEKPFFRKTAFLKHLFELAEFLRSGVVAMTLGHTPPKPNDKTQLVLKIEFPGSFNQPRIRPRVLHRYPRQSLRHAAIETRLSQCRKQHLIRVLTCGMRFEVSKARIFESRQPLN